MLNWWSNLFMQHKEAHLRPFFKNYFMFPCNIALKKTNNSNISRQAQLIWSKPKQRQINGD